MARHRILSVGQCGFDHGKIAGQLTQAFGAEVRGADNFDEAVRALRADAYDLVLVNRVTDEDGTRGLDLIRALKADEALAALAVMLVSSYPDAQAEAAALGALPGFGKSDLAAPAALERIRSALGA